MRIDLISGWAYPPEALQTLADALQPAADVVIHPFTQVPNPAGIRGQEMHMLAGWSLGGMKALQATGAGKWKPDGLILISSTARFCADGDYTCGAPRAALRSMLVGMRRDRDRVLADFFNLAGRTAGGISSPYSDEELLEGLRELDQWDLRALLGSVEIPVLLLHGGQDLIIPPEASQYLSDRLPRARLHINEQAGHALPVEEADWVAERIREFAGILGKI